MALRVESASDSTKNSGPGPGALRLAALIPTDKLGRWKLTIFALSLVLLAAVTFLAIHQHAPPQFEDRASLAFWKWWLRPIEQNPALRPAATDQSLISVAFATPQSGWAVGDSGTILHTEDGGKSWNPQVSNARDTLGSVAFATPQSGWAVGGSGTILHTEDGGKSWNPQVSNTRDNLYSVAFATPQSGWAVGDSGTILHTEDGGKSWRWMGYRRWPAPWFYVGALFCCVGLVWGCWPSPAPLRQMIEELANNDSPVTALKDDALGYGPLVDRLSRFIQNPKTAPPLVLSLQAPWGMGKSSIMRMLQSELKARRAAVTVWFNAWHHQKEDQLLACLMEAVQKQAVPPWFTPIWVSFRLDLLRVRLFSNVDRLVLTLLALIAVATGPYWISHLPDWLHWLRSTPPWLRSIGGAGLIWVLLQPLLAFKGDPEKLMDRAGGSALRALKELLTLPSLIGKSDVRQEFAANLKDVVEALAPQRLVIFLDDLDRCRPEQVVQILEAVNFLSSVSSCFIVIGADYQKVEALAAKEFEEIATQEFENKEAMIVEVMKVEAMNGGPAPATPNKVLLRVHYARNYLKKIVNLRLNLKQLAAADFREFLKRKPQDAISFRGLQRLMMVAAVIALALTYAEVRLFTSTDRTGASTQVSEGAWASVREKPASGAMGGVPAKAQSNPAEQKAPEAKTSGPEFDRDKVGFEGGRWLAIGISSLVAAGFLIYWFSRPKRPEEAEDPTTFGDALELRSGEILNRWKTPREVRRFLNYLRLVATTTDERSSESIQGLRGRIGDFDQRLVDLATRGIADEQMGDEVEAFYVKQCDLFGLDPKTFQPLE